jgi:hypothetical protein
MSGTGTGKIEYPTKLLEQVITTDLCTLDTDSLVSFAVRWYVELDILQGSECSRLFTMSFAQMSAILVAMQIHNVKVVKAVKSALDSKITPKFIVKNYGSRARIANSQIAVLKNCRKNNSNYKDQISLLMLYITREYIGLE